MSVFHKSIKTMDYELSRKKENYSVLERKDKIECILLPNRSHALPTYPIGIV